MSTFCTIYRLYWILHLDLGRSAAYNNRRGRGVFEKWALSCEADIFMIVSKCWKPPEPVIIIIHRILCRGLGRGQWAVSLVDGEKSCGDLQYGAVGFQWKKKKTLIVFTVHVSWDIFKIYYTWMLFLVFNHLSSLSCNPNQSDYWVNIAVTRGVYKWKVSLCH